MKPFLPPAVPFGSHQWPTLITSGDGPGPRAIAQVAICRWPNPFEARR